MTRVSMLCSIILFIGSSHSTFAADPDAEVKVKVATTGEIWQGQRVIIDVTLKTPKQFANAPAFDLPHVHGMIFIAPEGSPVLGTETNGDKSVTTQTHELMVFPQSAGSITVPSFTIRFDSSAGFGKPVHSHTIGTEPVSLNVKQPPGSEDMAIVLTSADLEVNENWKPEPGKEPVKVGTAFSRTIRVTAKNLPGIVLPSFRIDLPDGLRSYDSAPMLNDQSERGDLVGQRTEVTTIVCEHPGDYELPGMSVVWWNPEEQKLQHAQLSPQHIHVTAPVSTQSSETKESTKATGLHSGTILVAASILLVAFGYGMMRFWPMIHRGWNAFQSSPHVKEFIAFRRIVQACRSGDARASYDAIVVWQKTIGHDRVMLNEVLIIDDAIQQSSEFNRLKASIYGDSESSEKIQWSSTGVLKDLRNLRNLRMRYFSQQRHFRELPDLNPKS